jgi:regulator of protease activity HflC (stomatin/prohibitin superfamily)
MIKKFFVLALIALSSLACTRISPGHVGIVVNQWGSEKGVADYTPTTGTFTYNPLTTSVFDYPTFTHTYVWTKSADEGSKNNEEITFTIRGNMAISVDVSIAYSLDPTKVPAFYVKFRNDDLQQFTDGFLRNVTRDCFNEVGGHYDLDNVMGDNAQFLAEVRAKLETIITPYGVKLDQFGIIGAPRPPQAVQEAINAKIHATQLAIQKQNELVQAQADAAKTVASAEGEAKSILMVAQAQAKANLILSESLTERLLQLKAYEKWNGTLPTITGGGTIPMITLPNK